MGEKMGKIHERTERGEDPIIISVGELRVQNQMNYQVTGRWDQELGTLVDYFACACDDSA